MFSEGMIPSGPEYITTEATVDSILADSMSYLEKESRSSSNVSYQGGGTQVFHH